MLWVRRAWEVLVGVSAGLWTARIVVDWLLGVDGTWLWVATVALGLAGAAVGIGVARDLKPYPPAEQRDAILGWGGLIGAVAALACLAIPMPWGAIGAVTVAALTVAALRSVPKPPPEPAE
jgi:hypothetical protein